MPAMVRRIPDFDGAMGFFRVCFNNAVDCRRVPDGARALRHIRLGLRPDHLCARCGAEKDGEGA